MLDVEGFEGTIDKNLRVIQLTEGKSFYLFLHSSNLVSYNMSYNEETKKIKLTVEKKYKENSSLGSSCHSAVFGDDNDTLMVFDNSYAYLLYKKGDEYEWTSSYG